MKYPLNHFNSWIECDRHFDVPVNLYLDKLSIPNTVGLNVALLCEPQSIINTKDFFIKNKIYYDVILTHNQEVLDNCDNSELFEFGSCWITDFDYNEKKEFEVSFLVGGKSLTIGHNLRHVIWNNQEKISLNKNFFNSSHFPYRTTKDSKILGNNKLPLFKSQFHICVENSKENNYFSEKLIDCFYTKTIPIYWGCPNIGEWFNTDSIIIVNSVEEIINFCNTVDEDFYIQKIKSINENYENCKKFLKYHDRVTEKIKNIVDKKLKNNQ